MPVSPFMPMVLVPTLLFVPISAHARPDPEDSELCLEAARKASEQTGVPFDALHAISVVETGRQQKPWPWTVNLGGEGHWPATANDAAGLVLDAINNGATNIDIGCFQLNYRWHAEAFGTIEDMLDPSRNALYAAQYLASQYAETGDWALAAAAYHSATPEFATRYQSKFEAALASLDGAADESTPEEPLPSNRFPLLIAGSTGRNGSLFPDTPGGLRLFGGS